MSFTEPLFEISTITSKRNNILREKKLFKNVLMSKDINLDDYKKYKFDKTVQVFLKSPTNIKNLEKLKNILKLYKKYYVSKNPQKKYPELIEIRDIDNTLNITSIKKYQQYDISK